jgi:hypothetical protein
MTTERANMIYDILVNMGGAAESMRDNFLWHHTDNDETRKWGLCKEWRFGGHLSFGGKYRSERNVVDCYQEDETPERLKLIKEMNEALVKIDEEYHPPQKDEYVESALQRVLEVAKSTDCELNGLVTATMRVELRRMIDTGCIWHLIPRVV